MAKRSNINNVGKRVKVDEKPENSTVLLKSQYPAIIKYVGTVTGKSYTWSGAGTIVEVDFLDAADLLSKMMNHTPCCNSPNKPQPKFVEV